MKLVAKRLYRLVLGRLPVRLRRTILMWRLHGRLPRNPPATLTEKINWRIVNDRRPLIAVACDKLATKQLASNGVRCPETFWTGTDVAELASVTLPERWVIKPSHTSGKVHFGSGVPDIDALRSITEGWLEPAVDELFMGHWGYEAVPRLLIVEEMLGSGDHPPDDFKLYVFDGSLGFTQHCSGRFDEMGVRFYSADWEPMQGEDGMYEPARVIARPPSYERMVAFAEQLGARYDFIRVDLYNVDGEIFLGELTPYPCSGMIPFTPASFDHELGAFWTLPDLSASTSTTPAPVIADATLTRLKGVSR